MVVTEDRSDRPGRIESSPVSWWQWALALAGAALLALLIGVGCSRVQPHHLVLPEQFSLGDTSFLPTMEAVTGSPATDGNKLGLLEWLSVPLKDQL